MRAGARARGAAGAILVHADHCPRDRLFLCSLDYLVVASCDDYSARWNVANLDLLVRRKSSIQRCLGVPPDLLCWPYFLRPLPLALADILGALGTRIFQVQRR